jgi:hypothetical protein
MAGGRTIFSPRCRSGQSVVNEAPWRAQRDCPAHLSLALYEWRVEIRDAVIMMGSSRDLFFILLVSLVVLCSCTTGSVHEKQQLEAPVPVSSPANSTQPSRLRTREGTRPDSLELTIKGTGGCTLTASAELVPSAEDAYKGTGAFSATCSLPQVDGAESICRIRGNTSGTFSVTAVEEGHYLMLWFGSVKIQNVGQLECGIPKMQFTENTRPWEPPSVYAQSVLSRTPMNPLEFHRTDGAQVTEYLDLVVVERTVTSYKLHSGGTQPHYPYLLLWDERVP